MAFVTIAVTVGLALINAGIQYWRSRKAEDEAQENVRVGGIPQVTEAGTIPVVFGTVRLQSPNVVFKGNLETETINIGGEPTDYYKLWIHQVWCQGPVDKLEALTVEGNRLGTQNSVGSWDLTAGVVQMLPGDQYGLVRWRDWDMTEPARVDGKFGTNTWISGPAAYAMPGGPFQNELSFPQLKTQVEDKYGTALDIASYRGVLSTFFQPYWAQSVGNLAPISAIVTRIYSRSFGEDQWQPTLAEPSPGQMNPVHIIREVITDRQWGRGKPESAIDETTFLAAAQTLFDEGFGMGVLLEDPRGANDFIRRILEHIDGTLYEEPTTGKISMKLVRADYTIAQLPIITTAEIIGNPTQSQVMPVELVNEVSAEYVTLRADRARSMTVHDTGAQLLGPPNAVSRSYPYVQDPGLVGRLLTRDLRQLGLPLSNWELTVTREAAADLRPGDVFVLNYPDYQIEEMVLRIKSYTVGTLRESNVRFTCIEDAFAFEKSILGEPDEIVPLPRGREPAPVDGVTFDLPLWMIVNYNRERYGYAPVEDVADVATWQWGVVAERSQEADIDWALYEDTDGSIDDAGEFVQIVERQPFCVQASFAGFTMEESPGVEYPLEVAPRGAELEMEFADAVESFGERDGESVLGLLMRPFPTSEPPMLIRLDDIDYSGGTSVFARATFGVMGSTAPYDPSAPRSWALGANDSLWIIGYLTTSSNRFEIRRRYAVDAQPRDNGDGFSPAYAATSRTVLDQYIPSEPYEGDHILSFREFLARAPYPPARVEALDDVSKSQVTIDWRIRSRLAFSQLSESNSGTETEEDGVEWRVRIYDGTGQANPYDVGTATLLRTITEPGNVQFTSYLNSDEISDRGGSLADVLIIVVDAVRGSIPSSHRHHVIIDRRP